MTKNLILSFLFLFALSMQTKKAFSQGQTIEAQAEETIISSARQAAQNARDDLIVEAEQDCLTNSKFFEVLRKWTSHRKSGFKWVAIAGAVVSCR